MEDNVLLTGLAVNKDGDRKLLARIRKHRTTNYDKRENDGWAAKLQGATELMAYIPCI